MDFHYMRQGKYQSYAVNMLRVIYFLAIYSNICKKKTGTALAMNIRGEGTSPPDLPYIIFQLSLKVPPF